MKMPAIKKLHIPELIHAASNLPQTGKLATSDNGLVYLDIDDGYIHKLFPLLKDQQIKKPNYFGKKSAGAHISVIYPEENKKINLAKKYSFTINDIVMAEIGIKKYYALLLDSPSLLQLRRKCDLPDMLCFKGYAIGFHITIGVSI